MYFARQRLKQIEKIFLGDRVTYLKEINSFEVLTTKGIIEYEKMKALDKRGLKLASIKFEDNGQVIIHIDTKDYDFKNVIIVSQTMLVIMFSLVILSLASKTNLPPNLP